MSGRGRYEDFSTLLFLVPFVASGLYAIYLWVSSGITLILPTAVYLNVTRDPYVFLGGTLAVLVSLMVDLSGIESAKRHDRLAWDSSFLQKTAAACFVLALVAAWYANGFSNVLGAAQDFVLGRYSIVFPSLLVLLSYLVNPALKVSGAASTKVLGFLAMIAVPAVIYEVGKRNVAVGLSAAAVIMALGLFLLLRQPKPSTEPK